MTELHRELGKVTRAIIGREDHGILTFQIGLKFGGSVQSFGGYALDVHDKAKGRRVGCPAGIDLLNQMLTLFAVDELQNAVGKYAYALRTHEPRGCGPGIIGLERPGADGGAKFLVSDWQRDWA